MSLSSHTLAARAMHDIANAKRSTLAARESAFNSGSTIDSAEYRRLEIALRLVNEAHDAIQGKR